MQPQKITIRETFSSDLNDIREVERLAFGQEDEAKLTVELLMDKTAEPVLSLLASDGGKAVGHILFTRVYVNDKTAQPLLHILAPLAVVPEYQKQGIGGMLIKEGLKRLKALGSELVFVLGHVTYYPKYGFLPDAGKQGFEAPYPIPVEVADAWMVQSLADKITVSKGKVVCCKALDKEEYWRE